MTHTYIARYNQFPVPMVYSRPCFDFLIFSFSFLFLF